VSPAPAPFGLRHTAATFGGLVDWLIEPVAGEEPPDPTPEPPLPAVRERPVVAVSGLRRRTGVTTVARALATLLATGDASGACVVAGSVRSAGIPLGSVASGRLARELGPVAAGRARSCGRLCLVEGADPLELCAQARYLAPVVLDVGDPAGAASTAAFADGAVLVCTPTAEPSLGAMVAAALAAVGPSPVVVLNRAGPERTEWEGACDVALPDSRMGAALANAGRPPRGALGAAVRDLAGRWEAGG
jgi:hypothetical protein